jgi:hypothetical protein
MSLVHSLAVAIALGMLVATSLPAAADPSKITKYVFPDGTVVYSDKPVPGATAVGEVFVPPAPARPPAKTPAAATPTPDVEKMETPPPAPDNTPPLIAEAHDGKCHLRVTSGWQWVEIRIEGLVPHEPFIMELRADGELTLYKATATDEGERGFVLFPAQLAKSGVNSITVKSGHCEFSASFRWPP